MPRMTKGKDRTLNCTEALIRQDGTGSLQYTAFKACLPRLKADSSLFDYREVLFNMKPSSTVWWLTEHYAQDFKTMWWKFTHARSGEAPVTLPSSKAFSLFPEWMKWFQIWSSLCGIPGKSFWRMTASHTMHCLHQPWMGESYPCSEPWLLRC